MPRIISAHSFRGGTGKSNTTANLAALIASNGKRVGVVDADIQSPGIHVLFGLDPTQVTHSLNDYLWGKCSIADTAHDVSANISLTSGKVFLVPASLNAGEIARVLRTGYDVGLLNDGLNELVNTLKLDLLFIDTHPGLQEETLLSIALSDVLIVILRPDQQDYQGTSVTVEVARKLQVPQTWLLVNKVPAVFNLGEVQARVEKAYGVPVIAVLPHSDDWMALASAGIFSLRYPEHPLSASLKQIAGQLVK